MVVHMNAKEKRGIHTGEYEDSSLLKSDAV
jgi:hypothetical protein